MYNLAICKPSELLVDACLYYRSLDCIGAISAEDWVKIAIDLIDRDSPQFLYDIALCSSSDILEIKDLLNLAWRHFLVPEVDNLKAIQIIAKQEVLLRYDASFSNVELISDVANFIDEFCKGHDHFFDEILYLASEIEDAGFIREPLGEQINSVLSRFVASV